MDIPFNGFLQSFHYNFITVMPTHWILIIEKELVWETVLSSEVYLYHSRGGW